MIALLALLVAPFLVVREAERLRRLVPFERMTEEQRAQSQAVAEALFGWIP